MTPSERARAAGAPVSIDVLGLEPGEQLTIEWRNVPAPTNLVIPAHHFVSETKIVIGRDTEGAAS